MIRYTLVAAGIATAAAQSISPPPYSAPAPTDAPSTVLYSPPASSLPVTEASILPIPASVTPSLSAPPYPTTTDAPEDCAQKCILADNACRIAPLANQSFCSSELASCLSYNPYENTTYATPTACSASSTASTSATASPTGKICALTCVATYRECQSDTTNPRSLCASNISARLGYNPFDDSGSFVTPSSCFGPAPTASSNATGPVGTRAAYCPPKGNNGTASAAGGPGIGGGGGGAAVPTRYVDPETPMDPAEYGGGAVGRGVDLGMLVLVFLGGWAMV